MLIFCYFLNQLGGFFGNLECSDPFSVDLFPIATYYSKIEELIDVARDRHAAHSTFSIEVLDQLGKPYRLAVDSIGVDFDGNREIIWESASHGYHLN